MFEYLKLYKKKKKTCDIRVEAPDFRTNKVLLRHFINVTVDFNVNFLRRCKYNWQSI